MTRTMIPLTEKQRASLARLERETGHTRAEVIRDALEAYVAKVAQEKENRLALLRSACGMWKDRGDIPDFHAMRLSEDRY